MWTLNIATGALTNVTGAIAFDASAGFIQNRNQAKFTLNGTGYTGLAVAPGTDSRGVIVGMVHRF